MQDTDSIMADLVEIDGQPMTTSPKVAARFGKRHDNVIKHIRRIESEQPNFFRENFSKSVDSYVNGKGGKQTREIHRITNSGAAILAARMKQPWGESVAEAPPTVRPEFVFGEDVVERLFSGYTIIRQFPVFGGKYRIDWYIPELRLAVEFDEAHHETPSSIKRDAARQTEIEAALGCRFLRYKAD